VFSWKTEILHNEVTGSPYEMFICIVLTRVGHVETLLTFCEFLCRMWNRACEMCVCVRACACVLYMQQYFFFKIRYRPGIINIMTVKTL